MEVMGERESARESTIVHLECEVSAECVVFCYVLHVKSHTVPAKNHQRQIAVENRSDAPQVSQLQLLDLWCSPLSLGRQMFL